MERPPPPPPPPPPSVAAYDLLCAPLCAPCGRCARSVNAPVPQREGTPVTIDAEGEHKLSTSPLIAACVRKWLVVSKVILRSGEPHLGGGVGGG